jgi:hypothetical protein
MKRDNVFSIYNYSDAQTHQKTLNKNQLENYTWIRLPDPQSLYLSLLDFRELNTDTNIADTVTMETGHPWIRVETSNLNTECGYHSYKLKFTDSRLNDDVSYYFSYTIQDDNPDKPYIYT